MFSSSTVLRTNQFVKERSTFQLTIIKNSQSVNTETSSTKTSTKERRSCAKNFCNLITTIIMHKAAGLNNNQIQVLHSKRKKDQVLNKRHITLLQTINSNSNISNPTHRSSTAHITGSTNNIQATLSSNNTSNSSIQAVRANTRALLMDSNSTANEEVNILSDYKR